jgi:hypothetical protein
MEQVRVGATDEIFSTRHKLMHLLSGSQKNVVRPMCYRPLNV